MITVIDALFWWTGGVTWAVVIALLVVLVWVVVREAFLAAWHLVRFYSWGWTEHGKWYTPFKVFWYFFWDSPRYVIRNDTDSIIYRPFAEHRPEDQV